MHFLAFFGPAMVAPGIWKLERMAFVVLGMLTGPMLTQAWTAKVAGYPEYRLEWPAVWCLCNWAEIGVGWGGHLPPLGAVANARGSPAVRNRPAPPCRQMVP
jgi:hypothetical protein